MSAAHETRLARAAEVAFALAHGIPAVMVWQAIDRRHLEPPWYVEVNAWVPPVVALLLAVALRPGRRVTWGLAMVFAVYVLLDTGAGFVRLARLTHARWGTEAWTGFGLIGLELALQAVVFVLGVRAMRADDAVVAAPASRAA